MKTTTESRPAEPPAGETALSRHDRDRLGRALDAKAVYNRRHLHDLRGQLDSLDLGSLDAGASWVDHAAASVERDSVLAALERARRALEEVEEARARLDAGEYGTCRTCHRHIALARLEAIPECQLCVRCQQQEAVAA